MNALVGQRAHVSACKNTQVHSSMISARSAHSQAGSDKECGGHNESFSKRAVGGGHNALFFRRATGTMNYS